ncbi:Fujikurins efflux protein [Lachnellula hyalina]|uniref:Fujikurins efflux protein n=1 Tax=Lachnellula hyalina TaxID=1316788 RepID=A0A8H8R8R0_9HELO|nr:Fujikurins efflux protein [Lachnellula hyalina]TVY28864.1 Fujikurins efflux protein [Lachnellula hyalina]
MPSTSVGSELQTWDQPESHFQEPISEHSPSQLGDINNIPAQGEGILIQQLAPADGGAGAWRLLGAAFVFEALLWGDFETPSTFKSTWANRNYYSSLPQFAGNSNVALIGTIAQGACYLGAPASAALAKRFPKFQRQQIWLGWPLCILGLVAGSFTTTLPGLIATQGVMYGVGFVTLTYPIISFIDEWWIARKGMAFGIISAASGASGIFMPFIIEALLKKYGYKTTLRAIAVGMAVLTGPLLPFLKGRLPPAEQSAMGKTNWSFFKKPLFWIFCASTLLQGLGFFFPALYLPSYATAIGLSSTSGALILAIMSLAQVIGQFSCGYLSDKKMSVSALCIACSVMSTIAAFALWGLAKNLALLLVFGIVYGFFGYGFTTMRVGMGRAVSDDPSAAVATYAILVFLQGVETSWLDPLVPVY